MIRTLELQDFENGMFLARYQKNDIIVSFVFCEKNRNEGNSYINSRILLEKENNYLEICRLYTHNILDTNINDFIISAENVVLYFDRNENGCQNFFREAILMFFADLNQIMRVGL